MSEIVTAVNPRTGELGDQYTETSPGNLWTLVDAAKRAASDPSLAVVERRATAMKRAAARLRDNGSAITQVAENETGLPPARLTGELERTCAQLEMLADMILSGDHYDAIIDLADPTAAPVARPDIRRMLVPLGPVAVFGASNFPLAFSTAGGDTASALAAGCPVIVKGHPSHPGTGKRVATQLGAAIDDAGLPKGTFAHLISAGNQLGEALVTDDRIEAVAFTGSFQGGSAILRLAAARPRPIPVFAEMGSVNPLIVTLEALRARGDEIAAGAAASIANFGGQLCTKPGVLLVPAGALAERFARVLRDNLDARAPEVLLNRRIADRFESGLHELSASGNVRRLTRDNESNDVGYHARPALFATEAAKLAAHPALREEYFGPAAIILAYGGRDDLAEAITGLGGQLTATVHAEASERREIAWLIDLCTQMAGRVIFNGFPTGVSVCWAMQHGGPYPASSAPNSTSVGMTAIRRFMRPVAFQDAPAELLHPALQDGNPLGIWRRVNGSLSR